MPYKKSIMPLLDSLDDLARKIGAVNNVYVAPDGTLHGTNTDWNGIVGCLENARYFGTVPNQPALIIGAGGASRAAVYALSAHFGRKTIYVANRDDQEVEELVRDLREYPEAERPQLIHVRSVEQAKSLERPYYVVGTVPDFESRTREEMKARDVLEAFLAKHSSANEDGTKLEVLLDLCYTPLETRLIKLGRKHRWTCVHGPGVVVRQRREQWKLWVGEDAAGIVDEEEEMAWTLLEQGLQRRHVKGVEGTRTNL
jgi:quinate dehydrogenase